MDYTEYFMNQSIDGDGPILTDHEPATHTKEQATRRFGRRDAYRAVVMINTEEYLEDIADV